MSLTSRVVRAQARDPFTFAFPGYITIRRFADLASPRLDIVLNRSWRTWTSQADPPIFYHWLDADGALLVVDGARSPRPRPVAPGR